MHVIRRRGWEIPERLATPEHLFVNRRGLLAASAAAALSLAPKLAFAQRISDLPDPTKDLYPVGRNEKYTLDRPITDEKVNTSYNNFYEFGSTKTVAKAAQALKLRPWTVKIDGMVEEPQKIDMDELIKMPMEERLYRHRCVEAWSMAIPWSGFPMKALIELAKPMSGAKYVRDEDVHESFDRIRAEGNLVSLALHRGPDDRRGDQRAGVHRHRRLRQAGVKSRTARRYVSPRRGNTASSRSSRIQRFIFTDQRPVTYWMALGRAEYGFWANVNPEISHPRWSQATEELLGTGSRGRHCSTTATAKRSRISTKGWSTSGCGRERSRSGSASAAIC